MQDPVLLNDWHIVARAEDVPPMHLLQVYLLGHRLVLWRCEDQIKVWQDQCPHRGIPLSSGWVQDQNTLVCPYHGMVFDGEGHCLHVPASPAIATFPKTSQVRSFLAKEQYGYIWVTLGKPVHDIPYFAEWDQPGFFHFLCGAYTINTSAPRVIENFTDVAHLPFVHEGLLGDRAHPEISEYQLTTDHNGLTAHNIEFYQPDPEGTGEAKSVSYIYKILRPLIAYFCKGSDEFQFSIFLAVTPVEELKSIAWLGVSRNYAPDAKAEDLRAFQDHLMSQDIPMLESQHPQRLPLDLQAEFHFPADQLAIAYRKWLKQLGLVFGTC
ncbi:MAG: aromatic ring-hydroxylating dioxygenase subunit alpha [Oculatellaceae cyanobacterium bins.114]|nr:aromatic ring-hydroxylating dioxygenase subunit alpha [Oculatellaceae cyanobacterium bins.114]